MRYLIRHITDKGGDVIEHHDAVITGNSISIGQSIDQDLQISGHDIAAEHAIIDLKSGGVGQLKALTPAGISVNDATVKSATLNVGDELDVGTSHLSVITPPFGFDFALEFDRGDAGDDAALARYANFSTSLQQTKLNKRAVSWLLGLGLFILFFILPLAGTLIPPVQSMLQSSPLPSDKEWLSGPLQFAHRTPEISQNCEVCHAIPFIQVKNEQCVACHEDIGHHVAPEAHKIAELQEEECASCHMEHNEPTYAVEENQALCSDCHSDLNDILGKPSELKNATDFGTDHPDFSLTLLTPPDTTATSEWIPVRSEFTAELKEQSNLKFPHKKHLDLNEEQLSRYLEDDFNLDAEGIKQSLNFQCSDCHQLDAGGRYILTISMERDCRQCHQLRFDPDDPQREVPHGDPDQVMLTLEEYYSRKYLEEALGAMRETNDNGRLLRSRPGQPSLDEKQRQEVLKLARDRAHEVGKSMFEATTCGVCHEYTKSDDENLLSPWRILPVKLTERWMPKSKFSHHSHRNIPNKEYELRLVSSTEELAEKGRSQVIVARINAKLHIRIFDINGRVAVDKSEDELVDTENLIVTDFKQQLDPLPDESTLTQADQQTIIRNIMSLAGYSYYHQEECTACHAAENSEHASDVLMPKIAICHDCHLGQFSGGADDLASTCILCHDFHLPNTGVMR